MVRVLVSAAGNKRNCYGSNDWPYTQSNRYHAFRVVTSKLDMKDKTFMDVDASFDYQVELRAATRAIAQTTLTAWTALSAH